MTYQSAENVAPANPSTRNISLIVAWIVPIIAVLVAGWLVWRAIPETSAIITVTADNADGLSAMNTRVKYRGVPIGIVQDIQLTSELDTTRLTLELDKGYEAFARQGAEFSIVKPEFSTASFESLRTIVSGPYIAAYPGSGEPVFEFQVAEHGALAQEEAMGVYITLKSQHLRSIKRNTPISWRGKDIGRVEETNLLTSGQEVEITVGILEDYQHLIRTNSVFWNSGGIDVDVGLFRGAEVRAESMQALIQGDISVATPDEPADYLQGNETFTLHEKPEKRWLQWRPDLKVSRESSALTQ